MELSIDWIQYVLDRPMDTISGTKFVYNSGVSVLLGKIIRIATGKRINKWAEEKLFGPQGITDYYWKEVKLIQKVDCIYLPMILQRLDI